MRIVFYLNAGASKAEAFAREKARELRSLGHDVVIYDGHDPVHTDAAVILGGDGTVLRGVEALADTGCVFLAVNFGHLGYLTACDGENASDALRRLLNGDYRTEERIRLSACAGQSKMFYALNDISIQRGLYTRALRLEIAVDGVPASRIRGDGLIVSTPTGSTAYNAIAGGPILLPESQLVSVTPICAGNAGKPMVIPSECELTVTWNPDIHEKTGAVPYLSCDGGEAVPLCPGEPLHITGDRRKVSFVRFGEKDFFEKLLNKLHMDSEAF